MTLFITIIIGILLFLALGIFLCCTKKYKIAGRILVSFLSTVIIAAISFISEISILFSTIHKEFYSLILLAVTILVFWAVFACIWGKIKKKIFYIPLLSGALICIIAVIGFNVYQKYEESVPSITESDDLLKQYSPYTENSKIVTLDEEPTLKLDDSFPRLDGATALYPIYSAFAKALYPQEHMYNLNCSTTSRAYKKIVDGQTDIIFAAAPSAEQEQYAKDNGVELIYTPIGKEAFVFFVNRKNPIENISLEDIQKIYSGEITNWSKLGVHGLGSIKAFQRDNGSGSQSALIRLMEGKDLAKPPSNDVIGGMGDIISKTADYKNFRNAIGYSFRFYSMEMVKNNMIKLISINGVYPSIENIENNTYPIASYFYAVTRSDANENTNKVVEWVCSEQGQKIIELTGYTPVSK